MVRAEDASKVNRIFERFDLSTVDMASVKSEIERDREEKAGEVIPALEQDKDAFLDELLAPSPEQEGEPPAPERITLEQDIDDFLSEVLGAAKEGEQPENPTGGGPRNPVSPSLFQSTASKPHRVFLIRRGVPRLLSGRSWTRSKRNRKRKRRTRRTIHRRNRRSTKRRPKKSKKGKVR